MLLRAPGETKTGACKDWEAPKSCSLLKLLLSSSPDFPVDNQCILWKPVSSTNTAMMEIQQGNLGVELILDTSGSWGEMSISSPSPLSSCSFPSPSFSSSFFSSSPPPSCYLYIPCFVLYWLHSLLLLISSLYLDKKETEMAAKCSTLASCQSCKDGRQRYFRSSGINTRHLLEWSGWTLSDWWAHPKGLTSMDKAHDWQLTPVGLVQWDNVTCHLHQSHME